MKLNNSILSIDIKVQDRMRKRLSELIKPGVEDLCVILGDSDIDYELSPNMTNAKILNAPYSVEGVRHKLIYNGVGKNLAGVIKCFVRKVVSTGQVKSLYTYPADEIFSNGVLPPTIDNAKDFGTLVFDDSKMGYILYFSTVLDYYFDADGKKKRVKEEYDFTFDWDGSAVTNTNFEYVIDNINGSLLLMKNDTQVEPIGTTNKGSIIIKGQFSQKSKKVLFNY